MKKLDQRILGQEARRALSKQTRNCLSHKITDHLLTSSWIIEARVISCYVSFRDEVETHTLIKKLLKMGKEVCIPHTEKGNPEMKMVKLNRFETLEKDHYGILSLPLADQVLLSPKDIDVCLLPGSAFDRWGNRIGYGAGYYDRYLKHLRSGAMTCGLAFSVQIMDQIQVDNYDVPLKKVVTDQGFIR